MILYLYPVKTAFIERDLRMLDSDFKVKPIEFTQNPKALLFYFILQFFQLLWNLPRTESYLCFFAGYHSVLPTWFGKVFGKPCVIQAGGTDASNMPEINYGNFRKKWLRKATVYSFKNCSLILPVAESLISTEYTYDTKISSKQGIKNLIPSLTTPFQVTPNGFDTKFWIDQEKERKPLSFITLATGTSKENRAKVKGYDMIEALAKKNPQWQFTLVGDKGYQSNNPNIEVRGKENRESLRELFNQHTFYLQLSTSEGFPNSLAEAMSCGCVPIGSNVGAIKEIIGDSGFVLQRKDSEPVISWVKSLSVEEIARLRKLARKRISEEFHYEKRKGLLIKVLNEIIIR